MLKPENAGEYVKFNERIAATQKDINTIDFLLNLKNNLPTISVTSTLDEDSIETIKPINRKGLDHGSSIIFVTTGKREITTRVLHVIKSEFNDELQKLVSAQQKLLEQ